MAWCVWHGMAWHATARHVTSRHVTSGHACMHAFTCVCVMYLYIYIYIYAVACRFNYIYVYDTCIRYICIPRTRVGNVYCTYQACSIDVAMFGRVKKYSTSQMILGIPGESRIASPEKAVEGATMVKGLMLCDKRLHLFIWNSSCC